MKKYWSFFKNINNKRVSCLCLILTLFVGLTYAYFAHFFSGPVQVDIRTSTETADTLSFFTDKSISIDIDQDSFSNNVGSLTQKTAARALLTANSETNSATMNYYVYLNIVSNSFSYTSEDNKPEILLTLYDNDGNEIKDLNVNYYTVKDRTGKNISGYDITDKSGLITLVDNKQISAASSIPTEHIWRIAVTFVNYDFNQSANAGATFDAKLIIQKEKKDDISTYGCNTGDFLNACLVSRTGIDSTFLLHDVNLKNGANDNSYRYSGGEVNNYVCFGSDNAVCPIDNLYRIIGVFSSNAHGLENTQLVKLIKDDYANSNLLGTDGDYTSSTYTKDTSQYYTGEKTVINRYFWNKKNTVNAEKNTWSVSLLNTVNLNINYLNNIGGKWSDMISPSKWHVGGNLYNSVVKNNSRNAYINEITTPNVGENSVTGEAIYPTHSNDFAKIGLPYVSDYGYAVDQDYWTYNLSEYSSLKDSNWMYKGLYEWTITRSSDDDVHVFFIFSSGGVDYRSCNTGSLPVRPTFYLNSNVKYKSGTGTKDDPIRLEV